MCLNFKAYTIPILIFDWSDNSKKLTLAPEVNLRTFGHVGCDVVLVAVLVVSVGVVVVVLMVVVKFLNWLKNLKFQIKKN